MTEQETFAVLGLEPSAGEAEVKKAYRERAKTAHPDAGGSDEAMTSLNEAYEAALKFIERRVNPVCVCRGFLRNPLCRAHDEASPKREVQCSRCQDTKKVEVGGGFSAITVDCPDCSFTT